MKFSTRDLATLAVFGALWGLSEIFLGSSLHTMNVPFTGLVMTGIGMTIALTGSTFVPRPGAVLVIGLVTAILKAFSLGGVVLNPMIAIVAESLLAEAGLALGGRRRGAAGLMLAGVLAAAWDFVHPFFTQGLLAGAGMVTIYERTISKAAETLGLSSGNVVTILIVLAVLHLVVGAAAGLIALGLSRQLARRLQPQTI
jgi:ABC-type thiamin/hydroxymethylpyrimidine transport system permease subunit